jgi:hypothetical protein
MKITKQKLKLLVETLILNEGQVEDLLAANPQLGPAADAGIKNPNHLKWLLRMEKFEPIADIAGLIPAFIKNKQRLAIKDLDLYRNPNDLRAALEALGESEGDKRRQLRDNETDIVYNDEQWIVVMPHTMESSIQWGKGTTWCTAATKSANLFYSYVGRKKEDIILYYIIRKGADSNLDPNAKLSVGFLGGKPVVDGKKGGLTVNASNHGLTESSLKEILNSKFDLIMKSLESHAKKIGGKHPAKKEIKKIAASKNPSVIEKYTVGMKPEDRSNFLEALLDYDVSAEVLTLISIDESPFVRERVTQNPNTSIETLSRLIRDEDELVKNSAIKNPNMPIEILTLLASDEDEQVRISVAENPNTPIEIIIRFASDKNQWVRSVAAENPNMPIEILNRLANDGSSAVREYVAKNPNTPTEILTRLANDGYEIVISAVAQNPNTPVEVLAGIVKNEEQGIRNEIAKNPNTPNEILTLLASDEDANVRASVVNNPTYQKYLESQKQLAERWIKLAGLLN